MMADRMTESENLPIEPGTTTEVVGRELAKLGAAIPFYIHLGGERGNAMILGQTRMGTSRPHHILMARMFDGQKDKSHDELTVIDPMGDTALLKPIGEVLEQAKGTILGPIAQCSIEE